MNRIAFAFTAAAAAAALVSSCYRPSDEYLAKAGQEPADEGAAEVGAPGTGDPASVVPLDPTPPAADSIEADVRTLFEKQGMKALPTLDQAVSANPDDAGLLLQGAFAGLGNDTEQCQETLLYLTIRHPELAEPLARAAGALNPETTSFLRAPGAP